MASVGGSLTWEAKDLEGELCLGAGVGAAGREKMSQTKKKLQKKDDILNTHKDTIDDVLT